MRSCIVILTLLLGLAGRVFSFLNTKRALTVAAQSQQILSNPPESDRGFGINDPYIPTPQHILPEKKPFHFDQKKYYYERFINGSGNGFYRRSSCPAINTLANRGFINRSGRNVTYPQLAHAVRKVWNFGDDNVRLFVLFCKSHYADKYFTQSMLVLAPTFALHGWPETIDLDMFNVRH